MLEKQYTADIEDGDCGFLKFTIIHHDSGDEPWEISSDAENDTHETLDQLLFWNLIIGEGPTISETMREEILADFGERLS